MVQPGYGGALDTPRTNIGDATYLSRQPDFGDISQEASFQSPPKEDNFLQQLRNGGRSNGINLRTPRQRGPLADRRNLPPSIGGAEFTPLLKSATRNSVRRYGKENGAAVPNTPALDKIDEGDITSIPRMDTSMYTGSRNMSYMDNTLPQVDASSAASTPMALPPRRGGDKGPLSDGNQLSLREQENVIDRIEKENFGLKLKIHFLEEALRKAGPGFSEAALKENTELKVDKVTMQRELQRYKKHLTIAEKDLESYRQQMIDFQEKSKRKYADESQKAEMEKLRRVLDEREADIEDLHRQLEQEQRDNGQVEKLQDDIGDLEADLREKDRQLTEREDELEDIKDKMEDLKDKLEAAEEKAKVEQRRNVELEEKAQHNEELEDARDTIQDLELKIRQLEDQADAMREKMEDAAAQKERAEGDLEELQEELANKSVVTKGLSRQIEEKVARLQEELDKSGQEFAALEKELAEANQENGSLKSTIKDMRKDQDKFDRERRSAASQAEDLEKVTEELNALEKEFDDLSRENDGLKSTVKDLRREQDKFERERRNMAATAQELDKSGQEYAALEKELAEANRERNSLMATVEDLRRDQARSDRERQSLTSRLEELKSDLLARTDGENVLHSKHDSLVAEAASLQQEVTHLTKNIQDLEHSLAEERQHALEIEKDIRSQYRSEMDRLNDEISDLQAEIRERDNLYDNDSEKWETEKRTLESERNRAEEKATGLQRTIDKLRDAEGTLSDKESKLQQAIQSEAERHKSEEAVLTRQIEDLQDALETRQTLLTNLRNELSTVRDELRQAHIDYQSQVNKVAALEDEVDVLQTTLDEEQGSGRQELEAARREADRLKKELERRVQEYEHQLSATQAARGDGNAELSIIRKDLSAARQKELDFLHKESEQNGIVRALRRQVADLERAMQDLEQAKTPANGEGNSELSLVRRDLSAARQKELEFMQQELEHREVVRGLKRQITDLEHQAHDYQRQLSSVQAPFNGDGNSELSLIRKDLTTARQKELDFLQRESAHTDVVKGLKRQIADLERQVHETEISRLIVSPKSSLSDSGRKSEVAELRHQLTTSQQTIHDLRLQRRETERKASQAMHDLQSQLNDLEDQKLVLEEVLEDAQQQAEETAAQHERAIHRMKFKLEKAERERNAASAAHADSGKQERHLRKSRAEIENLEHDIRQQQELIASLSSSEGSLRRKLERARSERAAFRLSAEKLQKDLERLKASSAKSKSEERPALAPLDGTDEALETVIRAAESAEERHKKELRGMVMQMEWMQARWQREASLRADAAYAKKFLQLQLDVANACNNAQLRDLEHIRTNLLGNRKPLVLPSNASPANKPSTSRPSLRSFLVMARFIARMRLSARDWAKQETVRRKLVVATEETKKAKRVRSLKVVRMEA